MSELDELAGFTESPIEHRLAEAIATVFAARAEDNGYMQCAVVKPGVYDRWDRDLPLGEYVIPQAKIDGLGDDEKATCRVDFLFFVGPSRLFRRAFAVECDGREWHAKSEEQVARDKRRDRRLLAKDIPTIRFTGSEIHRDAEGCANYLYELLESVALDCAYDDSKERGAMKMIELYDKAIA